MLQRPAKEEMFLKDKISSVSCMVRKVPNYWTHVIISQINQYCLSCKIKRNLMEVRLNYKRKYNKYN